MSSAGATPPPLPQHAFVVVPRLEDNDAADVPRVVLQGREREPPAVGAQAWRLLSRAQLPELLPELVAMNGAAGLAVLRSVPWTLTEAKDLRTAALGAATAAPGPARALLAAVLLHLHALAMTHAGPANLLGFNVSLQARLRSLLRYLGTLFRSSEPGRLMHELLGVRPSELTAALGELRGRAGFTLPAAQAALQAAGMTDALRLMENLRRPDTLVAALHALDAADAAAAAAAAAVAPMKGGARTRRQHAARRRTRAGSPAPPSRRRPRTSQSKTGGLCSEWQAGKSDPAAASDTTR